MLCIVWNTKATLSGRCGCFSGELLLEKHTLDPKAVLSTMSMTKRESAL